MSNSKSTVKSNGNQNGAIQSLVTKTINWSSLLLCLILHLSFLPLAYYVQYTRQTLVLGTIFYFLTVFSLSAGYNRHFAHRSFECILPLRLFFLFFGSSAFIGSALSWVKLHRLHHSYLGSSKDPMNSREGFLHAHFGWLYLNYPNLDDVVKEDEKAQDFITKLENDRLVNLQHSLYIVWGLLSGLVLPAAISHYLWNQALSGLVWAGLGHVLLSQHMFLSAYSLSYFLGSLSYSLEITAHDAPFPLGLFTLGEGFQNFHHTFPEDYRTGSSWLDIDPLKWLIWSLSLIGFTSKLKTVKYADVLRASLARQQGLLDRIKSTIDFGPDVNQLPVENWAQITQRVAKGAKLVVIDGLVHDVSEFILQHPGGAKILSGRIGKDATLAFNGTVYRHSKAARNVAAMMRVSRLPASEVNSRSEIDNRDCDEAGMTVARAMKSDQGNS